MSFLSSSQMLNSVDALLNNNNIRRMEAEPGKVAVDADMRNETLMEMMWSGNFQFEGESELLPSSMIPCLEVGHSSSSSPAIHLPTTTTTTTDLDHKVCNLNDDEGFQTPSKAIVETIESLSPSPSSQQRRRRKRSLDLSAFEDQKKRPDWLPLDWKVEHRRREGGATAGLTDRYYYEPGSYRQFRSKKEVLCYLETGTRRKYKGKALHKSNITANMTESVTPGTSEQNGSSSVKIKKSDLNFDFDNPPEKVTWVLNSFPEAPGSWTSIISGEIVQGHTRQDWDAAFRYHVHGTVEASSSEVDEVGVDLEAGA